MTSHHDPSSPALARTPAPGEADHTGAIYWPGDEEASRAPGMVLALLIFSFVAGGLYAWAYWPLMAGFDWLSAFTLKSSVLAVLGGVVLAAGGVLLIRHGLIWACRWGPGLVALPMARLLVERLSQTGGASLVSASLAFLLSAGPAILVFGLSFSRAVTTWRRRRHAFVTAEAAKRRRRR